LRPSLRAAKPSLSVLQTIPIRITALGEEIGPRTDAAAARDCLIAAAREAGAIALTYFRMGERTLARIEYKAGGSPVTEADLAVDAFLRARLGPLFANAGWLSEETEDNATRLACARVVIVDPIDGTRAFLTGDPRWAVSIALVAAGRPVAGVVHAPALNETYAAAKNCGAALNGAAIVVSNRPTLAEARVAGPKPMVESIARAAGASFDLQAKIPSLAYRMALVASGAVDFALASEKSHDWDIAAVDLILEEAGGRLVEAADESLAYNKAETRHGVLFGASTRLIGPLVAAGRLALAGPLA
jgi:myo-inositol-1(or 4)-monophosphatase